VTVKKDTNNAISVEDFLAQHKSINDCSEHSEQQARVALGLNPEPQKTPPPYSTIFQMARTCIRLALELADSNETRETLIKDIHFDLRYLKKRFALNGLELSKFNEILNRIRERTVGSTLTEELAKTPPRPTPNQIALAEKLKKQAVSAEADRLLSKARQSDRKKNKKK
jgi:hypothetical protein